MPHSAKIDAEVSLDPWCSFVRMVAGSYSGKHRAGEQATRPSFCDSSLA